MADKKKSKKSAKPLGKKTMKKTKGGILIGLKPPPLAASPSILPKGSMLPPVPCPIPPICN